MMNSEFGIWNFRSLLTPLLQLSQQANRRPARSIFAKYMKVSTVVLLVVLNIVAVGYGQRIDPETPVSAPLDRSVHLTPEKPSVFISYERSGVREPIGDDADSNKIFLRLHNNSIWSIRVCSVGSFDKDGRTTESKSAVEIGLNYTVEQEQTRGTRTGTPDEFLQQQNAKPTATPKGNPTGHRCSVRTLESGDSILFVVNQSDLAKDLRIRVSFGYAWEPQVGTNASHVSHAVYFSHDGVPSIRPSGRDYSDFSSLVVIDQRSASTEVDSGVELCEIQAKPSEFLNKTFEVRADYVAGFEMGWFEDIRECDKKQTSAIVYLFDEQFAEATGKGKHRRFEHKLRIRRGPGLPRSVRGTFRIRVEPYAKRNEMDRRFDYQFRVLAAVEIE